MRFFKEGANKDISSGRADSKSRLCKKLNKSLVFDKLFPPVSPCLVLIKSICRKESETYLNYIPITYLNISYYYNYLLDSDGKNYKKYF